MISTTTIAVIDRILAADPGVSDEQRALVLDAARRGEKSKAARMPVAEARKAMGVSKTTFYAMVRDGRFPVRIVHENRKTVYVSRSEFEKWWNKGV